MFSIKAWLKKNLLSPIPVTKGYRSVAPAFQLANYGVRPFWSMLYADMMLYDPQVWFGLAIGNGPLMSAEVEVTGPDDEVNTFVAEQWEKLWSTSAPRIFKAKYYGYAGFEVMYSTEESDGGGRIIFDRLKDLHPRDTRPLTQDGGLVGISVRSSNSMSVGAISQIFGPKALWINYQPEYANWYGRALMEHAYPPWYDKAMEGGALALRRLRMVKDAWVGDVLKYPLARALVDGNGNLVSARDLVREVAELRASGGAITLPSDCDENGKPLFEYTPPSEVTGTALIQEWIQDLDWDIFDGLLVPKEVVEAATSGSGYSGRSIPMMAFLSIRDDELSHDVRLIVPQILRPLVGLNYGLDASKQFEVKPKKLLETVGKQLGGGESDGGQAEGGDKGAPAQISQQRFGQPMQPPGKQQAATQFGGLFDNDEPRDQSGKWTSGGGSSRKAIPATTSDEIFTLTNEPGKGRQFVSTKTKQRKLLDGMDALPGQGDLFDEKPGEELPKEDGAEAEPDEGKDTITTPDGMTYSRAPTGGAKSPVNGKHYKGGTWMPIHGKSERPPGKSGKKAGAPRVSKDHVPDPDRPGYTKLAEIPEGMRSITSFVAGNPVKSLEMYKSKGWWPNAYNDWKMTPEMLEDLAERWKANEGYVPKDYTLNFKEYKGKKLGDTKKDDAEQFSTEGEQWITIGAVDHHGGTPVKISGGKIVGGPKALRGRSLKGLCNPNTRHHARLREAVHAAAKDHNLDKRDLHDAVEFVHGERARTHGEHEASKAALRKHMGMGAAHVKHVEDSGKDHSHVKGFDTAAREAAGMFPELAIPGAYSGGPDGDSSRAVWDLLREGATPAPAKHHPDTIKEAVALLKSSNANRYAAPEDAVPFSTVAEPAAPDSAIPEADEITERAVGSSAVILAEVRRRLDTLVKKN